jgi:hypothetical protein
VTQQPWGTDARARGLSLRRLRSLFGKAGAAMRRVGCANWRSVPFGACAELVAIALWAAWVGRTYLNFRPDVAPIGLHFGEVLPHFVWALLPRCGACVLWNGFANGGSPAFADIHGNVLHPLIVLLTLIWGGLNGTKVALVASFAMAGVAQWLIAKSLRLGAVARLWSAALAVAGGHLAGRMEDGVFPLVFSTAAVSMAIGPGIALAQTGQRRCAIWLGVALALAILSTQGYLLLGLGLCILPAFCVFMFDRKLHLRAVWREYALALGLAVLLSGIFWVPLLHAWPQFAKDADPRFGSAQPLEYAVLNLVIRDLRFFQSDVLRKQPFPFLYVNYIGWVPVILALVGLRLIPRSGRRILAFFAAAIVLVYLAGSAITFRVLSWLAPAAAAGVRNSVVLNGLAVPLVLGVAAWGLDCLLKLPWPRVALAFPDQAWGRSATGIGLSWLLVVPLVWSVKSAHDFGRTWIGSAAMGEMDQRVMAALRTETSQWIAPPFGEHYWMPFAYEAGLKVSPLIRPWHWKNKELPPAFLEATRREVAKSEADYGQTIGGITILVHANDEYAFVDTGTETVPCRAVAQGGRIDVDCSADSSGTLVVRENQWSGWTVKRDGVSLGLIPGQWLSAAAPAGRHHYQFRYRPWDVAVGLCISLLGLALAVALYLRREAGSSTPPTGEPEVN